MRRLRLIAGAAVFAILPVFATSASPAKSRSAAPKAGVVSPKPPIRRHLGKSFIPVLGDWEGSANGLPASFELRYDPDLPHRRAVPQYGISQLVALRPASCPATSSQYRETLLSARIPSELGRYGSLGLSRFGFGGSLTAREAATLTGRYRSASCSGTQTWHMHPAIRPQVNDGSWSLHFRDGESGSFQVLAGGRLATSIKLPHALTSCNGVQGEVDLFIGPNGRAQVSRPNVRISMRFSHKTAGGELDAGRTGCPHGPIQFTAKVH